MTGTLDSTLGTMNHLLGPPKRKKVSNEQEEIYTEIKTLRDNPYNTPFDQSKEMAFIKSILAETNGFYETNLRTGVLETNLTSFLLNIVDSDSEVVDQKGNPIRNVRIGGQETNISINLLDDIIKAIAVYGKVGLQFNEGTSGLILEVIEPWRYVYDESLQYVNIAYFKDKDVYYNERYLNMDGLNVIQYKEDIKVKGSFGSKEIISKVVDSNMDKLGFYELRGKRLITETAIEHSANYAMTWTELRREMANGAMTIFGTQDLFEDGTFKGNKSRYVTLNPSIMSDISMGNKTFFETFAPQLRDSNFINVLSTIDAKIASSFYIGLQASSKGSATSAQISSDTPIKLINRFKKDIMWEINSFLEGFTTDKLLLMPFKLQNQESIIKNAVLMKTNKVNDPELLQLINPGWTEDECMIKYLKVEIKSASPLTLDEQELAIKYGLIEEPIAPVEDPPPQQGNTGEPPPDSIASQDAQIDNAGNVRTQGVTTGVPGQSNNHE